MSEDAEIKVRSIIAAAKNLAIERVPIGSSFEELGIDSVDAIGILFELEQEFNVTIPDAECAAIRDVRQAVEGVQRLLSGRRASVAA